MDEILQQSRMYEYGHYTLNIYIIIIYIYICLYTARSKYSIQLPINWRIQPSVTSLQSSQPPLAWMPWGYCQTYLQAYRPMGVRNRSEWGKFGRSILSLKLTAKALENGWLAYDRLLSGWPIFRGELLVSGRAHLDLRYIKCSWQSKDFQSVILMLHP